MRRYTLRDKRGVLLQANVADSVNIDRTPKVRDQILAGEFHRIPTPDGGRLSVEKAFFYSDFTRKHFFLVLPRWDRHKWKQASADLLDVITHVERLVLGDQRTVRLIFGLAELREKLLAFDAPLSDEMLEALKVLAMYEHPHLQRSPRLSLVLDRVSPETVELVAFYDHSPDAYRIGYSRALVDGLFAKETELAPAIKALPGQLISRQEDAPLWVNVRRWSSSNWALGELHELACSIEDNPQVEINIDAQSFLQMLKLLPTGSELSRMPSAIWIFWEAGRGPRSEGVRRESPSGRSCGKSGSPKN